ncbi:1441_t:CDS:10 [Diversispora eburnea]|uniref:Protein farnesyltransferase subunit beta n=1 Tax=Diversispora eburnea TaxID=1213867 RepID=A0A9N8YR16_9GLOM|nr:1441_t:CDS:10 [Diversispora eburnea]
MGIFNGPCPFDERFTKNDGYPTKSSTIQTSTERAVYNKFKEFENANSLKQVKLYRDIHFEYIRGGLDHLHKYFVVLDASKPWLCYWMLHSLDLLGNEITPDIIKRGISTISKLQNVTGGFGGGPGQISHAAVTYAAVNVLATIGTKEAYDIIDRENLYKWFLKLKKPDGSFIMHEGGEVDVRGAYCCLSAAALTNLITPELTAGTSEWIKRSQNYDGGIGGEPGIESHGGYAFCGLAAMEIMGKSEELDISLLLRWASSLQMQVEGGFQGRPNKLVDGCYSFWVGALFPLLEVIISRQYEKKHENKERDLAQSLFDRESLQEYILIASQSPKGGFIDRPGSSPDYYHTCYCLSGLSTSQNHVVYDVKKHKEDLNAGMRSLLWFEDTEDINVVGDSDNLLVHKIIKYFYEGN